MLRSTNLSTLGGTGTVLKVWSNSSAAFASPSLLQKNTARMSHTTVLIASLDIKISDPQGRQYSRQLIDAWVRDVSSQHRPLHYKKRHAQRHRFLLHCCISGGRKNNPHRVLSHEDVLITTKCERVKTPIRRRALLFAGLLVRMDDRRLPKRVLSDLLEDGTKRGAGEMKACLGNVR